MAICIVALDYVGLLLGIQLARSGIVNVIGWADKAKADRVDRGRSYIPAS
jgi:UDP-N-acetyl-D-mannosaminuronate dehydrogenase